MSSAESFHDKWKSFLIETKSNSESLSEIDAVGGIGSALKKFTGTGARPTDRNISGRTSMVATPEPKSKSKYDGGKLDPNSYRGSKVQILTGDLSVKQAFKDIKMAPKYINKILVALKKDLEAEAFEIVEKKGRQEISLKTTIGVLSKMPPDSLSSDQRTKVVRVLSDLLQRHRVKLNVLDGTDLLQWARSNDSSNNSPSTLDDLPAAPTSPTHSQMAKTAAEKKRAEEEMWAQRDKEAGPLGGAAQASAPDEIDYDVMTNWVKFMGLADQDELDTGHPLNDGRMGLYRVIELDDENYGKLIYWRPDLGQFFVAPDDAKPVDN